MPPDNFQYKFDDFLLIPKQKLLLQNDEVMPLSITAFKVLLIMVKHEGRVVKKQDFMKNVWANARVEEGNLAVAINSLRKILNAKNEGKTYIETFPQRGYRFTANVEIESSEDMPREIATRNDEMNEGDGSTIFKEADETAPKRTIRNFFINLAEKLKLTNLF